jgi:hypothetical protein
MCLREGQPVPVAAWSKALVYDRSPDEIVGSNPSGGARMFVSCECCVLWGRGLCDELITRPEESCRLWCVVVCDLETLRMKRSWLTGGFRAKKKKNPHSDFVWRHMVGCLVNGKLKTIRKEMMNHAIWSSSGNGNLARPGYKKQTLYRFRQQNKLILCH